MPNQRVIAVNGSGGAWTPVAASIAAAQCSVQEDGAAAAQGLQVKFPQDGFTQVYTYPPGTGFTMSAPGPSAALGLPAQGAAGQFNYRAADTLFQVRSASASATSIQVVEQEELP